MGIFSTSKDDTTPAQRNFKPRTDAERERFATLAGSGDTKALRKATTTSKTKNRRVQTGGKRGGSGKDSSPDTRTYETKAVTTEKFDSISFDQAKKDFAGRGAAKAEVQAQPKATGGGGGGGGAATTSFQAGAITASGIAAQEFGVDANTPVNSKQRGR